MLTKLNSRQIIIRELNLGNDDGDGNKGEAKSRGWVGRGWTGRGSWVVGRVCLKIKKRYILTPSVLGPNLQWPAHELISPKSFYETLNKGKLLLINYKHFSFWSGKQLR